MKTTLILLIFFTASAHSFRLYEEYTISRQDLVPDYMELVKEHRVLDTIKSLSSYPNRYYTSEYGVQASKDLATQWRDIVANRPDATVKYFNHPLWPQQSVILTIKGSDPRQIIVGAHIDSVNTHNHGPLAPAPGADDNASGVASMTEIITVLTEKDYVPQHTLVFIAYAAEEQGMRGSQEIVEHYLKKGISVKGVLNLDGTNFKGSPDIYFALYTDFTSSPLTRFTGRLISHYLGLLWDTDKCGYICSDHHSWNHRGYPVAFPAEARLAEENPHIHTVRDTLEVSGNNAEHAARFSRLGLAFVLELDK